MVGFFHSSLVWNIIWLRKWCNNTLWYKFIYLARLANIIYVLFILPGNTIRRRSINLPCCKKFHWYWLKITAHCCVTASRYHKQSWCTKNTASARGWHCGRRRNGGTRTYIETSYTTNKATWRGGRITATCHSWTCISRMTTWQRSSWRTNNTGHGDVGRSNTHYLL